MTTHIDTLITNAFNALSNSNIAEIKMIAQAVDGDLARYTDVCEQLIPTNGFTAANALKHLMRQLTFGVYRFERGIEYQEQRMVSLQRALGGTEGVTSDERDAPMGYESSSRREELKQLVLWLDTTWANLCVPHQRAVLASGMQNLNTLLPYSSVRTSDNRWEDLYSYEEASIALASQAERNQVERTNEVRHALTIILN